MVCICYLLLLTHDAAGAAGELPGLLVVVGRVFVALLLLHDEAEVFVGLHAGTVVLQGSLW